MLYDCAYSSVPFSTVTVKSLAILSHHSAVISSYNGNSTSDFVITDINAGLHTFSLWNLINVSSCCYIKVVSDVNRLRGFKKGLYRLHTVKAIAQTCVFYTCTFDGESL